ncbi:PhoH-like protein [compost metagenome]
MSKRSQRQTVENRWEKKEETGRVIKGKFEKERVLPPITAKTVKQKAYFAALDDPEVQVVVALGYHGTGKTYCAAGNSADKYRQNIIEQITVARPYVQTGKTSGFKPGSSLEKLYPYVRNVLDTIKWRIGAGAYEQALGDGISGPISVQELESIRGRSFDRPSVLIIDEAQQSTPEEMESIVTRISDECKLILCGDIRQKDIRGESGLEWFLSFAKRHNLKGVAIIDFNDPEDIVRGGFVRDVAIGLMKDRQYK